MLSVSLDDVTENWSEVSRKGETFELFLSCIFLREGGGRGLLNVYDTIMETSYGSIMNVSSKNSKLAIAHVTFASPKSLTLRKLLNREMHVKVTMTRTLIITLKL